MYMKKNQWIMMNAFSLSLVNICLFFPDIEFEDLKKGLIDDGMTK